MNNENYHEQGQVFFRCMIPGDQSRTLWEEFSQWKKELCFKKYGSVIVVEYVPPLKMTACEVSGYNWFDRLQEIIVRRDFRAIWLDAICNGSNQWTSRDMERDELPEFGNGPFTDPQSPNPHDAEIRKNKPDGQQPPP